MQDTPRNIYAKFGSNQSSSFRAEQFCIIVKVDDNDDGRQVMAIAHLAFGQVSLKVRIWSIIPFEIKHLSNTLFFSLGH